MAIVGATALGALAAPATAHADDAYRDELLVVDAVSVTAGLLSEQLAPGSTRTALRIVAGGMLVGSPILHARHDRWGASAAALGLRVGPPALTLGAIHLCHRSQRARAAEGAIAGCVLGPLLVGGLLLGVGIALDYGVLARSEAPATPPVGRAHLVTWAWSI